MNKSKIIILFLIFGVAVSVPLAFAQTEGGKRPPQSFLAQLEATIELLKKQVEALQKEIAESPKKDLESVKPEIKISFTLRLKRGLKNLEVENLQKCLVAENALNEDYITGYFGGFTEEAVKNFQKSNNLPAVGEVGPLTRATLNKICLAQKQIPEIIAPKKDELDPIVKPPIQILLPDPKILPVAPPPPTILPPPAPNPPPPPAGGPPPPPPADPPPPPSVVGKLFHIRDLTDKEEAGQGTFTQAKVFSLNGKTTIISPFLGSGSCPFNQQALYGWDGQSGNLKFKTPLLNAPAICGYLSIPAIGDVTNDSDPEIVMAAGRDDLGGGIFVFSADGTLLGTLLSGKVYSGIDGVRAVLVPDADGDSKMEIVFYDHKADKLHLMSGNGTDLPGWPVSLSLDKEKDYQILTEPAVADFGDGKGPAIIVPVRVGALLPDWENENRILAYNPNGSLRWQVKTGTLLPRIGAGLAVGNLIGDKTLEIAALIEAPASGGLPFNILILDKDGKELTSWKTAQSNRTTANGLTLGDLNSDGLNEIIYHDEKNIYVTDYQGKISSGYPKSVTGYLSDAGVADLNNDGFQDVYFEEEKSGLVAVKTGDHNHLLHAFDYKGQSLTDFPYKLKNYKDIPSGAGGYALGNFSSAPVYADLDNDGKAEIIASKNYGRIEVIGLKDGFSKACYSQYGGSKENSKNSNCGK